MGLFGLIGGLTNAFFPGTLAQLGWIGACLVVATAALWLLWRTWPRCVEMRYSSPNTTIRVIEGDLFQQEAHLVVGMSTTFDTDFPVIAKDSVQGQLLDRIYNGDALRLRQHVAAALNGKTPLSQFPAGSKPGNLDDFPVGTAIALPQTAGKYVFGSAYARMQSDCTVRTSVDIIWESLGQLWSEIDSHANGEPVAIPVIGMGRSGISSQLPPMDSIRLVALSFIVACRTRVVTSGLDIVMQPGDLECVDLQEIQTFLDSLGRTS